MGDERRQHPRYRLWIPVEYDAGDVEGGLAVNHDIGPGGMLIALTADLEVGMPVTVTFALPGADAEQTRIQGTVGRIEANQEDPDGPWRHRVAVVFDRLHDELAPALESLVERISRPPSP